MNYEQAQDLNSSPMWENIKAELDLWISAKEQELRRCRPEQLRELQVAIEALEAVKNLPEIVKDRVA